MKLTQAIAALFRRRTEEAEPAAPAAIREVRGPELPDSSAGEGSRQKAAPALPSAARGDGGDLTVPAAARVREISLAQGSSLDTGGWSGGGGTTALRPPEDLEKRLSGLLRVRHRLGSTAGEFGEDIL